jgi:hypothetical protein
MMMWPMWIWSVGDILLIVLLMIMIAKLLKRWQRFETII